MKNLPKLNSLDYLNLERELYKNSLVEFVQGAWHVLEPETPYVHGWHVEAVCEHLEAVHYGKINRLLINIPPGAMKSTLVSVFFPAWEWGARGKPSNKYINGAHESSLSVRDTLKMRRLVQSEWFQTLYPDIEMTKDQNQKTYFENTVTGFRQATAVTSMTGKRGDRIIWDDPHSVEDAHSPANLSTAIRVLKETLPTRLTNPINSAIIIVMQRLNEEDVSGYILKNDLGYTHLCLPMEYDPSRPCTTSIGFTDPRTEEGELLFPGRFPRSVVDRDKKAMGTYAVAGQFQQRPTPKGGSIFKDEWWNHYTFLPKIKFRMVYGDTALKAKEQNDYSVFQCWGLGFDGNLYLIDQLRGKWESPELLIKTKAFWQKHKAMQGCGVLRQLKVEDKASGTGLIQSLQRDTQIPVKGIPRGVDKVTRAHDASPYIESGYVYLPSDASWLSDYEREFSQFPLGSNDDQVDPTMDAISDMLGNPVIDYSAING